MKKAVTIAFTFLICIGVFNSCKKFEYSPYQSKIAGDESENLNAINLEKLLANSEQSDDTVTIIYSGDSQRFYESLDRLVNKVNSLNNIDFLIISGDIADFGILQEYIWIKERLVKLNVPYLCAVGNHDLAANKGEIFERIFGEKNFSFTYKKYKFLFHDTNGREYGFNGTVPDLPWLTRELKDSVPSWFVGVSHVPPMDEDFDKKLERSYTSLFASTPGFIVSLHGHLHQTTDSYPYDDNVRYMTSNAVQKTEVVLLKIIHGKIIKEMISY